MQYRTTKKIVIDEQKLIILTRLGCPDDRLLSVIKTGKFEKTGDEIIDETLECLVDKKEFQNWGGKRINSGKKKKISNQVEKHLENQDDIQVVDIDIDKDIDKDKKGYYKGEHKLSKSNPCVKQKDNLYGELNNVRLTEEQYNSLKEKYPNLDEAIEALDTWLGKGGKTAREVKGKNHYAYFKSNSWVWQNVKPKEDASKYDTSWLDKYEITN